MYSFTQIQRVLKQKEFISNAEVDEFGNISVSSCPLCKAYRFCYLNSKKGFQCGECSPEYVSLQDFITKLPTEITKAITPDLYAINPMELASKLSDPNIRRGVSTGFAAFDKRTGGIKIESAYGFAAASKNLKSGFTLNAAFNIAMQGHPVLYFDLENGEIRAWLRLIQLYTGWTNKEIAQLETPQGREIYAHLLTEIQQSIPFFYEFKLSPAPHETRQQYLEKIVHTYKETYGLRLVVIDNVNCFPNDTREGENEFKRNLYSGFENIAIANKLSLIFLHHTTDKKDREYGVTKFDLEQKNTGKFEVPRLSKALGGYFENKITVGMTLAHDVNKQELCCWIQAERDEHQEGTSPFFVLKTHTDSIKISNFGEAIERKPFPLKKS